MAVPAQEMEDDSTLVHAVQAGDLEAYSELFRRHYPAVQAACTRRLANSLDAEEISQAAFVRALERIAQCTGDRPFGGWVQIIARHMCVDSLRARSRVVPSESPMSEDRVDEGEPHDSLIDRERSDHVRRALDTLPPRQRQAVTARALGTGPGQIADDLGLSVGAVDSLILRGRRRLALAYRRVAGESGSTVTVTASRSTVAASLLAALSVGPTRLLSGVAAAAEAGRNLVAPVAEGVAAAVVSVAVAFAGSGPTTVPGAGVDPADRPPPAVATVPLPDPTVPIAGAAAAAPDGTLPGGQVSGAERPQASSLSTTGATGGGAQSGTATGVGPSGTGSGGSTGTASAGPVALPLGGAAAPVADTVGQVAEVLDAALPAAAGTGPAVPDPTATVSETPTVVDPVVDQVGDGAVGGAVDTVAGLLPR